MDRMPLPPESFFEGTPRHVRYPAPSQAIGFDIFFLREEKVEEADTSELTRLLHAQQEEIVGETILAQHPIAEPPIVRERFHRMLSRVVIPRGSPRY